MFLGAVATSAFACLMFDGVSLSDEPRCCANTVDWSAGQDIPCPDPTSMARLWDDVRWLGWVPVALAAFAAAYIAVRVVRRSVKGVDCAGAVLAVCMFNVAPWVTVIQLGRFTCYQTGALSRPLDAVWDAAPAVFVFQSVWACLSALTFAASLCTAATLGLRCLCYF